MSSVSTVAVLADSAERSTAAKISSSENFVADSELIRLAEECDFGNGGRPHRGSTSCPRPPGPARSSRSGCSVRRSPAGTRSWTIRAGSCVSSRPQSSVAVAKMWVPASAQRQSALARSTECVDHRPWPLRRIRRSRRRGVRSSPSICFENPSPVVAGDEQVGGLERRPLLVEPERALTGGRATMDELPPREVVEVSGPARDDEAGRDARWRTVLALFEHPSWTYCTSSGRVDDALEREDARVDVAEQPASRAPQPLREDADRYADPVDRVSDGSAERLFLRAAVARAAA